MSKAEIEFAAENAQKLGDLISRSALTEKFKRLGLGEHGLVERLFADGVYAVIETFPAVDAVEVMRCKDCKKTSPSVKDHHQHLWCRKWLNEVKPNDFCIYGKRRVDDATD